MKLRKVALGLVLIGLFVCLTANFVAASVPMGTAIQDVYIDQNDPDTNQDTNNLSVQSQTPSCISQVTYLQFNFGTGGTGSNYQISLQAAQTNVNSNIGVYGVGNNWNEATLTFSSTLAAGLLPSGAPLTSLQMTGSPGIVTWPASTALDSFVNAARASDGIVSLALAHTTCATGFGIVWANIFCDKEAVAGGTPGCTQAPLPVTLMAVNASVKNGAVALEWTTASELNTEGFNVWRSEAADGQYAKVNAALIPAQGNTVTGADYSFADPNVTAGKRYYYKLEIVDTSGAGTLHDPVEVTVLVPGKVR